MIFSKTSGILGMNARNLHYISKYNSRADKKFADDKIFTKQFLGSRGIGVAKLYHVIRNHTQLTQEFFDSLPNSFVVKPNRGYAGAGIVVIETKKGKKWITAGGKRHDDEFLYRQCIDILEGKYSISGVHDQVIFEEKLEPHKAFMTLTEAGLPDIRVIAFNKVPTLAMLRVPTVESDGKANMELGAIAMGIDIGTGLTTGAAYYYDYIKKLPNGESAVGFQIPYWDEILLSVAKIQKFTKIGFLGADLVVTENGVHILEVNARAGLKIQIANQIPLRRRLEKVADLKVKTPKEGVDVAKTLFSEKKTKSEETPAKPVIGGFEPVIIYGGGSPKTLIAEVDLLAETNTIAEKHHEGNVIDISIARQRMKLPVERKKITEADVILAGKYLGDFYIDPSKKKEDVSPHMLTANLDEKVLKNIDKKVCKIDSQIKLLAYLNPQNITEQKALFLSHPNASPRFFYRDCPLDIESLKTELKRIPQDVNHFLYPIYKEKIKSLEAKLNLLKFRDTKEYTKYSKAAFGSVTQGTYRSAIAFLKKHSEVKPDQSQTLDTKKTIEILNEFLKEKKLAHWKIKILEDSVADIQVTKKNIILLKKGAKFKINRLKALLAHEIGTHVFRYENGKLQPLEIFARGTANYLETEEGLAIWNQNQLNLNLGEKYITPALLIVAIFMAEKMSFKDLYQYLRSTYNINKELAWKCCLKSKRGFTDTENFGAFTKDACYYTGNKKIEKFIKEKGNIKDLYIGKIAIEDLELIGQLENIQPSKFIL